MRPDQYINYLESENRQLLTDNRLLAKLAHERTYHVKRVRLAEQDALQLALWLAGGIFPSRRFAGLKGISHTRWQNAVALLRMARVVQGRRRWATDNLEQIEKRLKAALQRAIDSPEAYRARLPRHGRQ